VNPRSEGAVPKVRPLNTQAIYILTCHYANSSMSEKKCPICAAGSEGFFVTESYLQGRVSFRQICDLFNVTKQQALEHIHLHHPNGYEEKPSDDLQQIINYRNKFYLLLLDLEMWINRVKNTGGEELSYKTINALTSLIKEYRQVLSVLAELDGKINKNQVVVELQNYNQKLDEIVTLIVEELCDDCRAKVLGKLENVLNV